MSITEEQAMATFTGTNSNETNTPNRLSPTVTTVAVC